MPKKLDSPSSLLYLASLFETEFQNRFNRTNLDNSKARCFQYEVRQENTSAQLLEEGASKACDATTIPVCSITSRAPCGIHPAMTARKMTNIMLRQSRSNMQEVYYDQRLSSNRPAGPLDTDIFHRPNFDTSSVFSRTGSNGAKSG